MNKNASDRQALLSHTRAVIFSKNKCLNSTNEYLLNLTFSELCTKHKSVFFFNF